MTDFRSAGILPTLKSAAGTAALQAGVIAISCNPQQIGEISIYALPQLSISPGNIRSA